MKDTKKVSAEKRSSGYQTKKDTKKTSGRSLQQTKKTLKIKRTTLRLSTKAQEEIIKFSQKTGIKVQSKAINKILSKYNELENEHIKILIEYDKQTAKYNDLIEKVKNYLNSSKNLENIYSVILKDQA